MNRPPDLSRSQLSIQMSYVILRWSTCDRILLRVDVKFMASYLLSVSGSVSLQTLMLAIDKL